MDEKQTAISDNAIWLSVTGEQLPIWEVVNRYMENQKNEVNTIEMDDERYELERIKELVQTINFFEERYGGSYVQTVLEKGDPNTTGDWKWGREGKDWRNLLKDIGSMDMTIEKLKERILIHELCMFEDDFPDGVFAVPSSMDSPKVKIRALSEYCKRHGKKLSELTEEEMEQFLDRYEK